MEIAFVTPAYHPSVIGASFYCQDLAKYLKKKGHNVTVYTKINEGWKEKETIDGIEINRLPVRYFFGRKVYYSSRWKGIIVAKGFDVIHSHHYGYFPATAGLQAAKTIKKPHVFGPYYHPPVYSLARSLQFRVYNTLAGKKLLNQSNKVLPHTKYEMHRLLEIGGRSDNMEILPNIADTRTFKRNKNVQKKKLILFVSSLIPDKGADVALRTADELVKEKDATAVFIGRNDDPEVSKIAESVSDKIKFINHVPLKDLVKWYNSASVVVLPSRYEAFSRVLAEAQACGTPVVATRVGGIPEVVIDGKTGFLVDYGEWKEMKDKTAVLLDDSSLNRRMGVSGSVHVRKNFDSDVVGRKLLDVYRSLV